MSMFKIKSEYSIRLQRNSDDKIEIFYIALK